jgi:magnesium-protoporphyrin O-methyltransferase
MSDAGYIARRSELETYFDRTAVEAWKRLTSDAPLGRIRASVRAGRDMMRQELLSYLPADIRGARLLDAGCGVGALAIETARRGADVVAVDLSATLVGLAQERASRGAMSGGIRFNVGDMLDPSLGRFDFVILMDSLIHYRGADIARALAALAPRVSNAIIFTVAPWTPAFAAMHAIGRLFPRGARAPAIEPISRHTLERCMEGEGALTEWRIARTRRIISGFYLSQAMELRRK